MKALTFATYPVWLASLRLGIVGSLLLLLDSGSALFGAAIPAARLPLGGWKPGIPSGIPTNYTLFVNLKTGALGAGGTYGGALAAGNGTTDDTAAINAALAACPDGKYVYLPTGNYFITGIGRRGVNNFDGVDHSFSVLLKGDGPGLTNLKWHSSVSGGDGISLTNNSYNDTTVAANYAVGATTLTLTSTARYRMGAWVKIFVDNNVAFDSATQATIPGYMASTMSCMAKVTAISGNTITLDRAMRWTYGTSTKVFQNTSVPLRCGLEGFTIENLDNAGQNNIQFSGASECWVKNVESKNALKWHFRFSGCAGCEARQNFANGYAAGGGGGDSVYGYGLFATTGETLIEDNIAYHCRHALITEYGCQGNVFGYNYSREPINENQSGTDFLMGDMIQHGGIPHWNLWEGNVAATIKFDNVLAGSRYLTAFRNQVQRKSLPASGSFNGTTVANYAADVQRGNYYANLVGNVNEAPPAGYSDKYYIFGSNQTDESNLDTNCFPVSNDTVPFNGQRPYLMQVASSGSTTILSYSAGTTYLHGVYDIPTSTTLWDPANSDHTLPNSLYLSAKPAWWDSGVWPAVGPDLSTPAGGNPAYRRWQSGNSNPTLTPSPTPPPAPQNLHVNPTTPAR